MIYIIDASIIGTKTGSPNPVNERDFVISPTLKRFTTTAAGKGDCIYLVRNIESIGIRHSASVWINNADGDFYRWCRDRLVYGIDYETAEKFMVNLTEAIGASGYEFCAYWRNAKKNNPLPKTTDVRCTEKHHLPNLGMVWTVLASKAHVIDYDKIILVGPGFSGVDDEWRKLTTPGELIDLFGGIV